MAISEFVFGSPYRFVITRPANDCCLLPSDLVFCAIPFSTACYKTKNVSSNQILENITKVMSLAPETHLGIQHVSKVSPEAEKTSQDSYTQVYPLDLFTSSFFDQ